MWRITPSLSTSRITTNVSKYVSWLSGRCRSSRYPSSNSL